MIVAKFTLHHWCIKKIVAFSYALKKFYLSNFFKLYSSITIIWTVQFA